MYLHVTMTVFGATRRLATCCNMMSTYSSICPKIWGSKITCQTDPAFELCNVTHNGSNCAIGVHFKSGAKIRKRIRNREP